MAKGEPEEVTLNTVHEDLTAGFAGLKQDLTTGFGGLKQELSEVKQELREVKWEVTEVKQEVTEVKQEVRAGFDNLRGEMRTGLSDLKATLISGFQSFPTRESSEEMVRLLRENNRLQEERFTQLDVRIREQHLEILQVLRAVADGQRVLYEEIRRLSVDIKALVARLDALIRGRGDGSPAA